MSNFCPVCKNTINDDTVKCSVCNFTDLHREFITKEDAQEWLDTVVLPYRSKWKKQQIEKNIEIVCPVCKETLTKADKKCKNCGFAELNMEFINKEDGELWVKEVVEPYREKYEKEKYEKEDFIIENGVLYNKSISTLIEYHGRKNKKYDIPNSVRDILNGAFNCSHELIEINIPNSVENIDDNFDGCGGLENINVDERNKNYVSVDGGLYNKSLTDLIRCPQGKIGTYTVAEGTININSFYKCDELTRVLLPNSVEKIKRSAFEYCRKLESINLPNNLKEIGEGAFKWCCNLNAIEIPGSVEIIEKSTFQCCLRLRSIKLNEGILCIESGAFAGCQSLEEITIPDTVSCLGYPTFVNCKKLKKVKLSNNITEIGERVFLDCTSLKEIDIPYSVKYIKDYAFYGCENLTKIVIHKSVERIADNAFLSCKKLTIHCEEHSYAHHYAIKNNFPVQFI